MERYANSTPGLAATVGKVQTRPGAGNVIAGEVLATLDIRHEDDATRRSAAAALLEAANRIGEARGVTLSVLGSSHEDAVPTDLLLSKLLLEAASRAGSPARVMPSGAGHDARIVATRMPISMLFLRSPGGLSHHPDESVRDKDVEAALATALAFVQSLQPGKIFNPTRELAQEPHA